MATVHEYALDVSNGMGGIEGLTFELTGPLRWVGIWARLLWPKWRPAAMGPVERMVRRLFHGLITTRNATTSFLTKSSKGYGPPTTDA